MATVYLLSCGYTKLGRAYTPSSAPTISVADSANNLLVNGAATTPRSVLTGVFDYSYTGADGLNLIGLWTTSDTTVDQQDLHSHPYDAVILKAIETVDTVVDAIKAKTDNLPADPASESLLETYISVETAPLASSAAVGLVSSVVNTLPTAAEIDAQLSGTHGAGTWGNSTGGGAVATTVTVTVSSLPRDGVEVWVTTDEAGLNLVASGVTDALGEVDFMLDAGTYYVWKQLSGVNFTNPQTMVVS